MDDSSVLAQANNTLKAQQQLHPASGDPTPIAATISRVLAKIDATPEATEAERAERRQRDAENRRLALADEWNRIASRLGKRYRDCTLENFHAAPGPQQNALDAVRDYVARLASNLAEGRGVLLYGPPGTGKDHLATAIMRAAVLDNAAKVTWTDGADFYGAMRDNIDESQTEAKLLARFRDPDLLAISDPVPPLGKVDSAYQLSMLFRVVDRRYRDQRATLITLNVASREEAEQRLSPNIIDRLAHGALAINCNWPSYRRSGG